MDRKFYHAVPARDGWFKLIANLMRFYGGLGLEEAKRTPWPEIQRLDRHAREMLAEEKRR